MRDQLSGPIESMSGSGGTFNFRAGYASVFYSIFYIHVHLCLSLSYDSLLSFMRLLHLVVKRKEKKCMQTSYKGAEPLQ